jgi:hypothetical protein
MAIRHSIAGEVNGNHSRYSSGLLVQRRGHGRIPCLQGATFLGREWLARRLTSNYPITKAWFAKHIITLPGRKTFASRRRRTENKELKQKLISR